MTDLLKSLEDAYARRNVGNWETGEYGVGGARTNELIEAMIIAEKRRRRDMAEMQAKLAAAERVAKGVTDGKLLDIAAQVMAVSSQRNSAAIAATEGLLYARELLRQFNGPQIEPWESQNAWMAGP